PFRLKSKGKKMPAVIMSFGLIYNTFNAFFNGYFLGFYADYEMSWFTDYRFVIGVIIFLAGFIINITSDNILFKLRKQSIDYKIPHGGMFRFVSSPNYFGEMMEWMGFAILSWSLAGFSFFVWTVVNLLPRAFANHEWYQKNFPEYPENRKAILPFII
ncbi:MAG TPA: 3-oxo-5-alpha-steroid 4-dehydrogenase, partial [Bacteroidales bacterium]|nr:3-oxo-5-alpha-steroid 4-dehydrogenase [Bacteroidales bacterium]